MGRPAFVRGNVIAQNDPRQNLLFDFVPEEDPDLKLTFAALKHRIWTEHKAQLVSRYLRYFVFITKHGTYIDGFAGAQYKGQESSWAAKEVIESRPRWLRNFFLCDRDATKVDALKEMVRGQLPPDKAKREQRRNVSIECADFNLWVDSVLSSGTITPKEATFALLDQHTFECNWPTVQKLATHKPTGANKIELFYFLPVKWLHRALSAKQKLSEIERWWGNDEWARLRQADIESIRAAAARRFKDELGYRYAFAWPIFSREAGEGGVMYYMIHASDHPHAPRLMHRAYKKALDLPEPLEQLELEIAKLGPA